MSAAVVEANIAEFAVMMGITFDAAMGRARAGGYHSMLAAIHRQGGAA